MTIKLVKPGLIQTWNDANPQQQILEGDVIKEQGMGKTIEKSQDACLNRFFYNISMNIKHTVKLT